MSIIHDSNYKILEVMDLPSEIQDELCDNCAANDSGRIINPEYYPLLSDWLQKNGQSAEECYIGWWSW